jgi:CubicO group peptidase (beta-lactamase class C family)
MSSVRWHTVIVMMASAVLLQAHVTQAQDVDSRPRWNWQSVAPESQGIAGAKLEAVWANLQNRHTTALLVIRNDRIVFERYASGYHRTKPHYIASMAKALVGGVGLMVAMHDGRITPDDLAGKYVPQWASDPQRMGITVRHLASHTSGIEDAEANGLPHGQLTGWKGDFWKGLPPPNDPFTIARDLAPVCDVPGTKERYSNPGMAMLGYCITASLRGTRDTDLRSLLAHRVMEPMGVPQNEWSVGYGTQSNVDGMTLVATWGGGAYSPNAVARLGRLMLRQGNWEGTQLVSSSAIEKVTKHSGMQGHSGLGWWGNAEWQGSKLWSSAPQDAFGGAGAGQQFLLVVPSLDLIVVRNGEQLDNDLSFWEGLEQHVVHPVLQLLPLGMSTKLSSSSTPARTRR